MHSGAYREEPQTPLAGATRGLRGGGVTKGQWDQRDEGRRLDRPQGLWELNQKQLDKDIADEQPGAHWATWIPRARTSPQPLRSLNLGHPFAA